MLHAAVDSCSADTMTAQVVNLVLHKGDEWRDDNAYALHRQSGHLEGDALTASRRHQPQGVMPGPDAFDDVMLHTTKVIIAPILPKDFPIVLHLA